MAKIAPSLFAADFTRLKEELDRIRPANYIHVDVMDGQFVPNFGIGPHVISAVKKITPIPLDVHLMIQKPIRYIERFFKAGADIITVHLESDTPDQICAALEQIRSLGRRAGISVKPGTPAQAVLPYLEQCSLVLVMTVEPGFGGQEFMPSMLEKIEEVRRYIAERSLPCELEVDGGITLSTAPLCTQAGADVLVAGSAVFRTQDPGDTIRRLGLV